MSNERDPLYILGYQKGFASAAIKGQQVERERIIALLEAEMCRAYGEDCHDNPNCTARTSLIALIKGENE